MGNLDTVNTNKWIIRLIIDLNLKDYGDGQWYCKHLSYDLKHEEEPTRAFQVERTVFAKALWQWSLFHLRTVWLERSEWGQNH